MTIRTNSLIAACLIGLLSLSGCSILGGSNKEHSTRYAPNPVVESDATWPQANWQLTISQPRGPRMIDSFRIPVRPNADEIQVYKGAEWARLPSDMLIDNVISTLEDSGKIEAVARQGSGVAGDYKLVMELRHFESDYKGQALPTAHIEVSAKLLHASNQNVIASQVFKQEIPATSEQVPDVITAFSAGIKHITHDIAGWVLRSGNAHAATESN